MNIEKMFGIETDEQYIGRTSEEERVKEATEYICGILNGGNYEDDYNTDAHIDGLTAKGYWDNEKGNYLKAYFDGYKAGYEKAMKNKEEEQNQMQRTAEFAEILP